jgi:transposase
MDTAGQVVWKKRLDRTQLVRVIAQLSLMVIGMEACGGVHYWARRFREHSHTVKLMAPQLVTPYSSGSCSF